MRFCARTEVEALLTPPLTALGNNHPLHFVEALPIPGPSPCRAVCYQERQVAGVPNEPNAHFLDFRGLGAK